MKIQFIPQYRLNPVNYSKPVQNKTNSIQEYSYNPIAYRDYDITFGKRLFRNAEDFYAQDFNEQNMPTLLHQYIYEGSDTAFKKTIPPAQAMKEVYGALKFAQSLDMVKQIYPKEPLFKDLHSKPSIKAREGVLGELSLMKSDSGYKEKSLFKNGNDDLGLYILKKIYIEGKTLKEINKDFHKDTSVVYEGLGDIKYADLKAFGIHFPNRSFWKSFIATREDFPYVYIPRKAEGKIKTAQEIEKKASAISTPVQKLHRKKFDDVKEWELDKITKIIEDTNGSIPDIQRKIKKSGNSESNNFVSKYMGEIMSVTLERLHTSPEMKAFFEDYENLSGSQRAVLKKYWTTPNARQNMSIVMKSTIQMFMDAYDEDGENEEFQDLLEYAHNIKEERKISEEMHAQRQEYYEDVFKNYVAEIPEEDIDVVKPVKTEETLTIDKIKEMAAKQGANIQEIILPDGRKVIMTYNRRELCEDMIEEGYGIFPTEFKKRMTSHLYKSADATDKYLLAISLETHGLDRFVPMGNTEGLDEKFTSFVKEQLFPTDKINEVALKIGDDFNNNNKKLISNTRQILMELAFKMPFDKDEYLQKYIDAVKEKLEDKDASYEEKIEQIQKYYEAALVATKMLKTNLIGRMSISDISSTFKDLGIKHLNKSYLDFVDQRMEYYRNPLSSREIKELKSIIPDLLLNFKSDNSTFLHNEEIGIVWDLAISNAQKNPVLKKELLRRIKDMFIFADNTYLRSYLDKNVDERVKNANTEQLSTTLFSVDAEFMKLLAAYDPGLVEEKLRFADQKLYNSIKSYSKYSQLYFSQLKK